MNIALGNLPKALTTENIETLFRHVWHEKAKQKDDVWVEKYNENDWNGYMVKEGRRDIKRAWNENSFWDVSNCWIPHNALKAD